jgi:hypothetical protein
LARFFHLQKHAEPEFVKPMNRFQEIDFACLSSLAESIPGLLKRFKILALDIDFFLYTFHKENKMEEAQIFLCRLTKVFAHLSRHLRQRQWLPTFPLSLFVFLLSA